MTQMWNSQCGSIYTHQQAMHTANSATLRGLIHTGSTHAKKKKCTYSRYFQLKGWGCITSHWIKYKKCWTNLFSPCTEIFLFCILYHNPFNSLNSNSVRHFSTFLEQHRIYPIYFFYDLLICGNTLTTSVCHNLICITFPNRKGAGRFFSWLMLLTLGRKLLKLEELFSSVWKLFLNRVSYLSKSLKLMTAVPQRAALFFTRCWIFGIPQILMYTRTAVFQLESQAECSISLELVTDRVWQTWNLTHAADLRHTFHFVFHNTWKMAFCISSYFFFLKHCLRYILLLQVFSTCMLQHLSVTFSLWKTYLEIWHRWVHLKSSNKTSTMLEPRVCYICFCVNYFINVFMKWKMSCKLKNN